MITRMFSPFKLSCWFNVVWCVRDAYTIHRQFFNCFPIKLSIWGKTSFGISIASAEFDSVHRKSTEPNKSQSV